MKKKKINFCEIFLQLFLKYFLKKIVIHYFEYLYCVVFKIVLEKILNIFRISKFKRKSRKQYMRHKIKGNINSNIGIMFNPHFVRMCENIF